MRRLAAAGMGATAVLLLACSGATRTAGRAECMLSSADSIFLAGGPVYRDCAVDERATRQQGSAPPIDIRPPSPGTLGTQCYFVELEFVVDTNGVPEVKTARVRRSTDVQYTDAVLATLPRWRYSPAKKDGVPVRQIVREQSAKAITVAVVRPGEVPPRRPPNCPT